MASRTVRLVNTRGNTGTLTVDITYDDVDRRVRSALVAVTGTDSARLVFLRPDGSAFGRGVYSDGSTPVTFPATGPTRIFMQADSTLARELNGISYALGG